MKIVAFDTETYPILPGRTVPRLVCLSSYSPREGARLFNPKEAAHWFLGALVSENVLVAHNAGFDVLVMIQAVIEQGISSPADIMGLVFMAYEQGRIRCTAIRQKLIDLGTRGMRPSYSLGKLVNALFGTDISGTKTGAGAWRLRYNELAKVPLDQWPKAARDYALDDSVWVHKMHEHQSEELVTQVGPLVLDGHVQNENEQVAADFCLKLMTSWGLRVDQDRVSSVRAGYAEELAKLRDQIQGTGLLREDGSVDQKVLRQFVSTAYEGDPPKTAKGSVKYDKKTIEAAPTKVPALEVHKSREKARKLDNDFMSKLQSAGPLHPLCPSYDVLKDTGRTSSFNPNIQQMPRKGPIRPCIVARGGKLFVIIDYDCLEVRSFAQVLLDLGFDSEVARQFQANPSFDPHIKLACNLLEDEGIYLPYEEAVAIRGDQKHGLNTKVNDTRQFGKIGNFGLPGGMGAATFVQYARGYGVTLSLMLFSPINLSIRAKYDFCAIMLS